MADEVTWRLSGLDQAQARMRALPIKVQRRSAQRAARAGLAIVRTAVREGARAIDDPDTAESITKNVAIRLNARRSRAEGGIAMSVGIRGGARSYANTKANRRSGRVGLTYRTGGSKANPGGDTWYWRFIEFGTRRARAKPFMRPALANNIQAVTDRFAVVLMQDLDTAEGVI